MFLKAYFLTPNVLALVHHNNKLKQKAIKYFIYSSKVKSNGLKASLN
jgi:hypothetical protein